MAHVLGPLLGLTLAAGSAQPSPAAAKSEALKKSCDKGSAADCVTLAELYTRGRGSRRTSTRPPRFTRRPAT